jgi:hypothetical protein
VGGDANAVTQTGGDVDAVERMDKGVAEGVLMSKFLVLYRSPISAREQMANATPE